MTQEQLATAIGRTTEAVSNIEREKSVPSLETLYELSNVLGASIDQLLPPNASERPVGKKRLGLEAEALAALRSLSDQQLAVALVQLRALSEMPAT